MVRDVFARGRVPASCRDEAFVGACRRALAPGGLYLANTACLPRAEAGADLVITAKVGALDDDTARIDLTVAFDGTTVLGKAQVRVRRHA